MSRALIWLALVCMTQLLACDNDPTGQTCAPRTTQLCICPNGGQGIQTCTSSGWDGCQGCTTKQDAGIPSDGAALFGTEKQTCYPNGTCNVGLTCLSNLCVKLPNGKDAGFQDCEKKVGTEGEECYPNHSCNTGLVCLSYRCVRLPDAGAPELDLPLPQPDTALPKPDLPLPKPDTALPKPDTALPKPDVALPDMAMPDMALPIPDAVQLPDQPLPSWKIEKFPALFAISGISGTSPDNVWAVGSWSCGTGCAGGIVELHWDGAKWTSASYGGSSNAWETIWVSPQGDRFIGGSDRLIINGYEIQLPSRSDLDVRGMYSCTKWGAINGIWGTSSTDVFMTTDAGRILHYDGKSIVVMQTPNLIYNSPLYGTWNLNGCTPGYALRGIWGSDHNNIYASGGGPFHIVEPGLLNGCGYFNGCSMFEQETSLILRFNGQTWSKVTRTWPIVQGEGRLYSVWGMNKNTAFVAGGKGNLLALKGGLVWQSLSNGMNLTFESVHGNSTTVWFTGGKDVGALMTYVPQYNAWDMPVVPGAAQMGRAVWIDGDNIFLAGWNQEIVSTIPYVEKWTPAVIYYR